MPGVRRPILTSLLALTFALTTAPARAQVSDPFGAQSTPTPTAVPATNDQDSVSRGLLFGIAGAVLVVFVGLGWFITRDARRNLTPADRAAVERGDGSGVGPDEGERRVPARAKARARKRRRAQRQARKANRPR